MDNLRDRKPASVRSGARRAGEAQDRWSWVETEVWTERMLAALDQGVKGGRWFSLIDKVSSQRALRRAYEKVKRNRGSAGVDHVTIEAFGRRLSENLERLSKGLLEGSYQPQAIRRCWVPKAGGREQRPLGIPTVRDRVVQTALRMVMEPIYEHEFAEHSYGFRPGRGCHDALGQVQKLLDEGHVWVVDADLRSYFDTIPHHRLLDRVRAKISDGQVLALITAFLSQQVLDGLVSWEPERGTPQGAVISPLLSNIYLDPLDHRMADSGYRMIRYADDFVVLCRTEQEAIEALAAIDTWVREAGLSLHPDKTRIVDARQRGGFDFLGYHFERGYSWPRRKSLAQLKDHIRQHTHRANGHSLEEIIRRANLVIRGWYGYFRYSYYTTYPRLDGWIRMRLRSILRKRAGLKGRGRGRDHQRWPNTYFSEHGLFSLVAAHVTDSQPSLR